MKLSKILLLGIALSVSHTPLALAESAGMVAGLQMPAWLERGESKLPLRLGMDLQSGDKVITGNNAKVRMRLEEGSDVKLGENARIRLDKLSHPKKKADYFLAY